MAKRDEYKLALHSGVAIRMFISYEFVVGFTVLVKH